MRFLADESCDFAVVRALRSAGHDVLAVSEFQQRSVDRELMEIAYQDARILLTEDKDFGWLAFAAHIDSPGIVLIRFPSTTRHTLPTSILRFIVEFGMQLKGAFVVMRPGSIRISKISADD